MYVKAIMGIKSHYILTSSVRKSWQGDPCAPSKYSWNGLNCSNNGYNSPTIIALNLASSGLGGTIIASFLELKFLESLDLSNNILTGPLPDFSQLQHLKALNLSGNRLSGEIPSLLTERSNNGNRYLCRVSPCEEDKKNIALLVAGILSAVVFFIALGIVLNIIWRRRCNRKPASKQAVRSNEEIVLKTNNTQYTYSQILTITDNFDKMIGKGGCEIVYLGWHTSCCQNALAKMSSRISAAQLLMRVHHKNLASFLGYCNEVGHTGIIYEYMAYGNLEEYYTSSRLTEKSDVYSFGIVLLELITGQPAIIKGHQNTHIAQWVDNFLVRGDIQQIVDPRLRGDFDFGSMWKALEAAIACVPSISIQRPSMSCIVSELKESLEMEAAREKEGINSIEMNVVDLEALSGPDAR
ncbi:putative leucine-rich repeat receptor-like protein kinase [Glycine soja]